jgi:hypothetical protein
MKQDLRHPDIGQGKPSEADPGASPSTIPGAKRAAMPREIDVQLATLEPWCPKARNGCTNSNTMATASKRRNKSHQSQHALGQMRHDFRRLVLVR